jgi:predicted metal-dependent hydrolase
MSTQPSFRRPEGVRVTYRRMKFKFEDTGFDRYWHGGSPFRSLFWSQLSTAFEPGEKFFIDSARALRGVLEDPQLVEELQEFCRQEGHHTAQHIKFDRMNAALGVDVDRCRKRYALLLQSARDHLDPIGMLGITVALEHFTACFADQFFAQPELSAGADPNVTALWAWHAAEESEHRATCFDIFRAAGGNYPRRVMALMSSWTFILALSLINTAELLHRDGKLFTRDTLSGLGYLFGRRGVVTGLVPAFFAFLSPRFHPWKGVDASTIARWRAENSQYIQNPTNEAA